MKDDIKDNDRWGTMLGMTVSLDDIEEIEDEKPVAKSFNEVIHKFNPFHDRAGKFSSSRGMSSYSANPKTKAGQMAIERSTSAGYGAVMNVHRESQGENIFQNNNWVKSGQKPTKSQLARAAANAPAPAGMRGRARTNRVKGTMGATKEGAPLCPQKPKTAPQSAPKQQQAPQNQKQNQQTPNQQAQTAAQGMNNLAQNQQNKIASSLGVDPGTVHGSTKLGLQPRDMNGKTASSHKVLKDNIQDRVAGKDITSSVTGSSNSATDIAKKQGWDKNPTVTNDLATFQAAAEAHGRAYFRSVHPDRSAGVLTSDDAVKHIGDGKAKLNGSGGQYYGSGMYTVAGPALDGSKAGRTLGRATNYAQSHSYGYGDTQVMMTFRKGAKVADFKTMQNLDNEYNSLPQAQKRKYKDSGAYMAAKGYDGAMYHDPKYDDTPYFTVFNKSALIVYGKAYK